MTKKAGSGSESGFTGQRHGSADPDPDPHTKMSWILKLDLATVVFAVFQVARGGTYALWSLCKSKQNRMLIKKAGGFPLLAKLIKSKACSLKGLDHETEFKFLTKMNRSRSKNM
jgi:hypothetical protein